MCKNDVIRSIIIFITLLFLSISTNSWASNWEKIWGSTDFVVVDGETGAVYAKPGSGSSLPQDIYLWEGEPNVWIPLGMKAKKCVTSGWKPKNTLYCLSEEGVVYGYKGMPNSWESLGGPSNGKAGDIFGGPDQLLASATGMSADVFRWDDLTNSWIKIGGPGKTFVVGRSSDPEFKLQVYGQSPDNAPPDGKGIYQWSGGWYKRGGPAGSIYVSMSTLFATNPQSGDMMCLYPTGWKRIGGPGNMFATDNNGHLFGLSPDKKGVYRWTGTPNKWENIGGSADKIFAGWDRLLFATNPDTKDLWFYKPACPLITNIPNFGGTIVTEKMKPVSGKRYLLAILWDPQRPDHPAPSKQDIDQLLFGTTNSVKDWFKQNSGGKLEVVRAGVLGWYKGLKPADHYWDLHAGKDPKHPEFDAPPGIWIEGHVEKWTEAIMDAAKEFNFAAYDFNKDGKLTSDELTICVAIPQNDPFGTALQTPAGKQFPKWEPLVVQGVTIPVIFEWYIGKPPSFNTAAHELSHNLLGSPDMYIAGYWPYSAIIYSIMGPPAGTNHLDPVEKLKLGWLNWKVATQSGVYTLKDIETHNEALILYHPQRGTDEYFIIEDRWRGSSYDAGVPNVGKGIPMDGIGIWHVIENPEVFNKMTVWVPRLGVPGEWGRLGIRLIHANGGTPLDDTKTLFNKKGTIISDRTSPAQLLWLDGTRSCFEVKLLSDAGPEIQLEVTITCP
jgi:M6 family metalloprotease-like protein